MAELTARSNAVVVAVRKAGTALANLVAAVTPPKEPALRKALMAMADLGVRDALPNVAPGGANAASTLLEQTQAVSRTMGGAGACRCRGRRLRGASCVADTARRGCARRAFVVRVRMLLGNSSRFCRASAANGPGWPRRLDSDALVAAISLRRMRNWPIRWCVRRRQARASCQPRKWRARAPAISRCFKFRSRRASGGWRCLRQGHTSGSGSSLLGMGLDPSNPRRFVL